MPNIYDTIDDPPAPPAPANIYDHIDDKQYGFLPNAGASGVKIVAGAAGLAPDLVNAAASSTYRAGQTMTAAHDQGLTPSMVDPETGVPMFYKDSAGKLVDAPNMKGINTSVQPLPSSKDIEKVFQERVKQDTGFDASNVGQRSLANGGIADYAGAALPYLLTYPIGGLKQGAVDAYEAAPLLTRAVAQGVRSAKDAAITTFATTPGDLQERAVDAGVAGAIGAPIGAASTLAVSGVKRLVTPSVNLGVNDAGQPIKSVTSSEAQRAANELKAQIGPKSEIGPDGTYRTTPDGTSTITALPSTDPNIPGHELSLGQVLPDNKGAVLTDRTARTTNPDRFTNLAESQSDALKNANTNVGTGGVADNLGYRLESVDRAAVSNARSEVTAATQARDAAITDMNARIARFDKTGKNDPVVPSRRITPDANGNVDMAAWREANPDLVGNSRFSRFADGIDATQSNLNRTQQAYDKANFASANRDPHMASLIGGDVDGAMNHIFSDAKIDPKTGRMLDDSGERMMGLMSEIKKPTDTGGASFRAVRNPDGSVGSFQPTPTPSVDEAQQAVKRSVADFVGNKFFQGTVPADAGKAADFAKFVAQHETALRVSLGDEGFKTYQQIAQHMQQQTSVPSNFNTKVVLPDAKGVSHGLMGAGVGGGISAAGAIVLDQVLEHLGGAAMHVVGGVGGELGQAALITVGAGAAAGASMKMVYNAMKNAGIKTQADILSLAARYPATVGKTLLERTPSGFSERSARMLARSIASAAAHDQGE